MNSRTKNFGSTVAKPNCYCTRHAPMAVKRNKKLLSYFNLYTSLLIFSFLLRHEEEVKKTKKNNVHFLRQTSFSNRFLQRRQLQLQPISNLTRHRDDDRRTPTPTPNPPGRQQQQQQQQRGPRDHHHHQGPEEASGDVGARRDPDPDHAPERDGHSFQHVEVQQAPLGRDLEQDEGERVRSVSGHVYGQVEEPVERV